MINVKKIITAGVKANEYLTSLTRISKIKQHDDILREIRNSDPENIVLHGFKVFSQVDEDGIIEHVFNLISEKSKVFVEIGCGNGLENNTHYLLLKGWKGVWIDGSKTNIDFINKNLTSKKDVLIVEREYIIPDNVVERIEGLTRGLINGNQTIDFLSIDIDGYDYEVLEKAVKLQPRLVCVEYNPELRPPLKLYVRKDKYTSWNYGMYHGASLQSLYDLMESNNYSLIGCSLSGYNAFFVKNEDLNTLTPRLPKDVYQSPKEYLVGIRFGHKKDFGFLNQVLNS